MFGGVGIVKDVWDNVEARMQAQEDFILSAVKNKDYAFPAKVDILTEKGAISQHTADAIKSYFNDSVKEVYGVSSDELIFQKQAELENKAEQIKSQTIPEDERDTAKLADTEILE